MRASLDPRGVSPRMLPLVPSQCRAGCSGEPSATQNPSKDAPRRPEIFRKHGKSTRFAAGEKIPPMSNTLFQVLVFGFLFVLVALCLCRLHRPLFFVVSSMLHTSSPKRPAWAADCFLTHTVRDRPGPAPAQHRLSPQIPADTDPAPAAPRRPFLQNAVLATNLIVRGLISAEILFLDSVRALHPTSSGGADLFGQSPVRVPPTSSGGTFSAGTTCGDTAIDTGRASYLTLVKYEKSTVVQCTGGWRFGNAGQCERVRLPYPAVFK